MSVMRRFLAVTAGVVVAGTVFAVPAYAVDYHEHDDDYWQNDSNCSPSTTVKHICVSTVHRDHKVKSITVRVIDGLGPGTLRAYWGDFKESRSGKTQAKFDVDDRDGRTRSPAKAIRDSDLVCGSLERLGVVIEKDVCVAI